MNKNILILTPSLTGGGAEKLAANLSLFLARDNNVIIVTYREDDNEYEYSGKRINIDANGKNFFERLLCILKRIKRVKSIKKKNNIDYSISYLPQTDYVNIYSKHGKTEKTVINVVSNMSVVYPKGISKAFRKHVIKKADFVVTVSEGVRQDLVCNFGVSPEKTKTIYNSCNIKAIKNVCAQEKAFINNKDRLPERYIVSMGSFRHPKGHWHLIKAFSFILPHIDRVSLVILGDGVYREQYLNLIHNLGIEGRVYLPGFINPPYSIISHADVFVFSSVFEGFGNAVIEAMACGVPIISTDCDYGPREILSPKTNISEKAKFIENCEYGVLIPAFDDSDIDTIPRINETEKMMGIAIMRMICDSKQREIYARKGSIYCEKFGNDYISQQWINVLGGIK